MAFAEKSVIIIHYILAERNGNWLECEARMFDGIDRSPTSSNPDTF